jgi:hypothetical protein
MEKKEKTPQELYKLLKKSLIYYTLTAALAPFLAIFIYVTDKGIEGPKNLIILTVLTEVYCIMRALFDFQEKKEMEKTFSEVIKTEKKSGEESGNGN